MTQPFAYATAAPALPRRVAIAPHKMNPDESLSTYVFGKVQPQAVPLEEAVLGALMLDREIMPIVSGILRADMFYLESHQLIFQAAQRLWAKSAPIDLLTMTEEIRKSGDLEKVANGYQLVELSNKVASAANTEYHARIIAGLAAKRAVIRVCTAAVRDAYEDASAAETLISNVQQRLTEAGTGGEPALKGLSELILEVAKTAEAARAMNGMTGVTSGLREVNKITGGWQKSDLIVIAARPGMGKTALTMGMALAAAKEGKRVVFFSLEMSKRQLVQRIVSAETGIPLTDILRPRDGRLTDNDLLKIQQVGEILESVSLTIDDTPALSPENLRAKCVRLNAAKPIDIVFVDYLQLMRGTGADLTAQTTMISAALKALAKELDVPVIALSQLSRSVETRGGSKRPQLSDLRQSGSIEQDADVVAFIYRHEYYHPDGKDEMGQSTKGVAEIIFAKHRNGAVDIELVGFSDIHAKFHNIGDQVDTAFPAPAFTPAMPASFTRAEPGEDDPF